MTRKPSGKSSEAPLVPLSRSHQSLKNTTRSYILLPFSVIPSVKNFNTVGRGQSQCGDTEEEDFSIDTFWINFINGKIVCERSRSVTRHDTYTHTHTHKYMEFMYQYTCLR